MQVTQKQTTLGGCVQIHSISVTASNWVWVNRISNQWTWYTLLNDLNATWGGVLTSPLASHIPLWNGVWKENYSPGCTSPLLSSLLYPLTTLPLSPSPHFYCLAPSYSSTSPLLPLSLSHSLALSLLPESWLEVSQQGVEGALGHSHSQEEMEQLLAAAVSDEELSDSDFTWAPPTLSHTRTYIILRPCSLTPVLISNQEPEAVQLLTSLASMALWWWGLILAVGDCITYNPVANWCILAKTPPKCHTIGSLASFTDVCLYVGWDEPNIVFSKECPLWLLTCVI